VGASLTAAARRWQSVVHKVLEQAQVPAADGSLMFSADSLASVGQVNAEELLLAALKRVQSQRSISA